MKRLALLLILLLAALTPSHAAVNGSCNYVQGGTTTAQGFAGCDEEFAAIIAGTSTTTTTTAISAAGTTQTDATVLTATTPIQTWVVSTVASGAGVRLPAASLVARYAITNQGANALKIYGGSTNTIDGVATGTGISLPVGSTAWFLPISTSAWFTVRQSILSGDVVTTSTDPLTTTIQANSVALTDDTTGNYAAGDAEAGAALTGDSATGFFSAGALEVARGGTGAAPGADDQVPISSSTSAAAWTTIPDSDGATQKLQYDVTANTFSAGTDDDVPDAADYSNLSAVAPIANSPTGTITTSISTGRLMGRTTAASGVMEEITPDATLSLSALALSVVDVTCTGCLGATEIAGLDAGDTTTGAFADARVDGSLEADEVNSTLGTQTQGDYVATVADGTGIDGTASGEGSTYTPTLDLTEINSATWGDGSFTAFTFNAGAVDPVLTFGSGTLTLSAIAQLNLDDELEVRFFEEDANGSNYIGFKAPAAVTASVTCTFENDSTPIPDSCVGDGVDDGAGGSGDNVTVNGASVADIDLDDADPAAVSGANVLWQLNTTPSPDSVSAYVPVASTTVIGVSERATDAETITATSTTLSVTPSNIAAYFANGQLPFPATQNPSAGANVLDDYEEGSWTPTVTINAASTGITYTTQVGSYVKIGRLVIASYGFLLSSNGSETGTARLASLPFTIGDGGLGGSLVKYYDGLSAAGQPIIDLQNGTTTAVLTFGGATGVTTMTDTHLTNTGRIYGTLVYSQ